MAAIKLDTISVSVLREILGQQSGVSNNFIIRKEFPLGERPWDNPTRLDVFAVALCISGEMLFSANMKKYHMVAGSFIIFNPSTIIEVHSTSRDFKADLIFFSRDYLNDSLLDIKSVMPIMQYIMDTTHQLLSLDEDEIRMMREFYSLTKSVSQLERPLVMQAITAAMFRVLGDIYGRRIPDKVATKTRQEEYFEKFMRAVSLHHTTQRSVQFYAEILYITPKYLSAMIKEVSGRSVAEWIDEFVVQEAKVMLKFSTKSIQEIAYHLNFSTQSFFGKYFKRHTGLSPSQYRARGE